MRLHATSGVDILFSRSDTPPDDSRPDGDYWLNVSVNGATLSLSGSIDKIFMRGVSDVVTASTPLTVEQHAALATDAAITVDYWIWVEVPDRGSGSARTGSQSVPLGVSGWPELATGP